MKRLVFAVSVMFGFGFMCGMGETEAEPEKDVVVVPVPEDDEEDDDGNWCCQFEDADGVERFELTDGAAACNNEFGDRNGTWVNDSKCTPCCCKAPNDPDDSSKGNNFELTTAVACSDVGECLAADAKQCSEGGRRGGDKAKKPSPSPTPRPSPGRVDERKTRPGTPAPAPSGGGGGRGSKSGKRR